MTPIHRKDQAKYFVLQHQSINTRIVFVSKIGTIFVIEISMHLTTPILGHLGYYINLRKKLNFPGLAKLNGAFDT